MQELETNPIRLHKIISNYETYSSGQMDIRDCLEELSKQAQSNHRQLLTDLCTPQEQVTDYPFIRLWVKRYKLASATLETRLRVARRENLPEDTVFMDGNKLSRLNILGNVDLITLLKHSVKK